MSLKSSVGSSVVKFGITGGRQSGAGGPIAMVNTGGGLYGSAQAVVTTSGSQTITFKALRGYGDDFFNGWYVIGQECDNIAELEKNVVSDYDSDTGVFSFTKDWSGSPVVADIFRVIPPEAAANGGGGWVKSTQPYDAVSTSDMETGDIFSVTGTVKVFDIIGIITTQVEAQATTCQLKFDADTGAGLDIDLSTAGLDLNGQAAGRIIRWTGDFSDALIVSADSALEAPGYDVNKGVIMYAGDIVSTLGAESTGAISWYVRYESIDGTLVAV